MCLLWFTGRLGQENQIQAAIEKSYRWLDRYPDHPLVRWATTWIAGLYSEGELNGHVIEESAKWLDTPAAKEERLTRHGFLWLVNASGTEVQVQQAITQTTEWLSDHPDDDFIRVALLLFLVMRRGTRAQRQKMISKTHTWLNGHADVYGLTGLALRLSESAPDDPST